MEIMKELKSETKVKAFLIKHEGKYFRVSQVMRSRRPMETSIHACIVSGKIKDWKELWLTRTMDVEQAFEEFLNSVKKD